MVAERTTVDTTAIDSALEADAAEAAATPLDRLDQITVALTQLRDAQARLVVLNARVDSCEAEIKRLKEQVLPGLMDEAAVPSLTLEDEIIERTENVYASISEANRPAAGQWMEKNGYASLVKVSIQILFNKGDLKAIAAARKTLKANKVPYVESVSIHPQTLLAFVRERLAAGKEIPKAITYHLQPTVKISVPKSSKKGVR